MIINFFKNWFRTFRKHPAYILINLGGLTVGLVSFLFISIYVFNELSFDRFHKNYRNIYRVKIVGRMSGSILDQAVTAAPMAHAMLNDYPEILEATRLTRMGAWLIRYGENRFNEDGVLFADSTFFKVFDFKLLKGDPSTALVRPRSMILTQEYARKYFGDKDPMGQKLIVEADTIQYTVTGVIQNVPENSHIKFDMLGSMSSYPRQANNQQWISHNFYTYIVVRNGVNIEVLNSKLQDMVVKYVGPQIQQILGFSIDDFRKAGNDFRYVLEPLKDLHLHGAVQYNLEPIGSPTTVYIFGVIALLILLVAVINYVNMATARSAARAKEVGIRKVSGVNKGGLIAQFIGESVMLVAIAVIVSVMFVFLLAPYFNQMIGKELPVKLLISTTGIVSLLVMIILIGSSSGFYPAFVLASFNPAEVLKGTLSPGSMSKKLRRLLVIIQFMVAITIIIGSIIVYNQLNYLTKKDLGFKKENLIIVRRPDAFWQNTGSFREQILKLPGVEQAGFSRNIPGTIFSNNAFYKDDDPEKNTYLIFQGQASLDFPQALGVELVDGRFFSRDYGTDSTAVLLNETAVKSLGLTDPVGKYILEPAGDQKFTRLKIIGVMKDFNIESMHKKISPVCFTVLGPGGGDQYAVVRLNGNDVPGTIRDIEKAWQNYTSSQPFQYEFYTSFWEHLYSAELKTGRIFILFSILSILIACIGLLGLVAYMTGKRTREIGVRKSYGASNLMILFILSKEVIYLIVISSILAYPAAWFGSKYWLQGFASRVHISPIIFILSTLLVLLIGWLTISYQTIRAANYNPATALRME
jgi:putative ABC transport system permease protein